MRKNMLILMILLGLLLVGCSGGSDGIVEESLNDWFTVLETEDLDGNRVDSGIFRDKDITLINVWATWCGPCVDELTDLGELNREYRDKNVNIVGILVEEDEKVGMKTGISDEEREIAEGIIGHTQADYRHLVVSDSLLNTDFNRLIGFPTTFFVNSKGEFVGKEVVGAKSKDEWDLIINERLGMVKDE